LMVGNKEDRIGLGRCFQARPQLCVIVSVTIRMLIGTLPCVLQKYVC